MPSSLIKISRSEDYHIKETLIFVLWENNSDFN